MRFLDWSNYQEYYDKFRSVPLPDRIRFDQSDFEARKLAYAAFEEKQQLNSYDDFHGERFRITSALYWDYIKVCSNILELGGLSRIGKFFEAEFGIKFTSYEEDLRNTFKIPSESYDCILCLEVIEHLKDSRESENDIEMIGHFNYSGIFNAFDEVFRVLKPGGILVLTTPNANSLGTMLRIAWGLPPSLYELHVKELSPWQIKNFALSAGFQLEVFETFECYHIGDEHQYDAIRTMLKQVGVSSDRRENSAFYLLRKPSTAPLT